MQANRGQTPVKKTERIAADQCARVIPLRRTLSLRTIVSRIELIRESKKKRPGAEAPSRKDSNAIFMDSQETQDIS